jgi:pilus assembly protein CpaF
MVMMAELGLSPLPVRQQIAAALDLVVHTARLEDGARKVVAVSEVLGLSGDGLVLAEIFLFVRTGVSSTGAVEGKFERGEPPRCLERIRASGGDGWSE